MPRTPDPMAKARLLRAARILFARDGFAETRVEEIARRAGLAKGSFYIHFRSKEDAFQQIVEAFYADMVGHLDLCCTDMAGDTTADEVRAHLRELDRRLIEFIWSNRDVMRIIHTSVDPRHMHALHGIVHAQEQQIASNIERFQAAGVYRAGLDARACAAVITGGWMNITHLLMRPDAKPDLERWVDCMQALFLDGLLVR